MPKLGFKVFVIGFNKCGTRSLHQYFRECGLASCHGGMHPEVHIKILRNIVAGVPSLQGFDKYDACSDIAVIQSQFRHVDRDNPGSKFILNVRDTDRWILSRLNHLDGRYVEFMNLVFGLGLSWQEWVSRWRSEFMAHEFAVSEHFKDRPADLLRYDIENDEPARLAAFLNAPGVVSREALPRAGTTETKYYALDGDRIVKLST